RRLATCPELATLGPGQRVGQTINASFDVATLEVWAALLHGACLVLVPPDVVRDPARMAALLRSGEITTLFTVTALFHEVVRLDPGAYGGLDAVHLGGEAADPERLRQVLESAPPKRLVNAYGPTESTVISSWFTLAAPPRPGSRVPIGGPVAGTELLVRGAGWCPVPDGEAGELWIAGEGLARGYLGRPAATAAAFVPHPRPRRPGARAYRTGDLVRRLASGDLDFVGRRDQQVKVRGFRIELGEIEHRLAEHPRVAAAVVVLRGGGETAQRLVAYVVPEGRGPEAAALEADELSHHLAHSLPEPMVPAVFVTLDALPLTPHGKVDKQALPDPGLAARRLATPFVAPRTALETRLAELWSELLAVRPVGVHDSLFELGGHSLIATRLATRVRDELGVDLPMDRVFVDPTLAGWAEAIASGEAGGAQATPIEIVPRPDDIPPCFAQKRIWFLQHLQPKSLAYQAQARLELHGRLDHRAFGRALNEIVRRHESLRTSFPSRGGVPVQVIHPPAPVPLPVVDLQRLPEELRAAHGLSVMESIYKRNFVMDRLPLVRWIVFRLARDEHHILHVEHHLVHDGWSFNRFLQELGPLYRAALEDRPSPLPPIPIQFADFALWQDRWLDSDEARRQLDFWRGQLSPPPETLRLPLDRPRPPAQGFRGRTIRWQLPSDVSDGVRELARRHGSTVFMTLLAGFHALLHRLTGQTDLANGSGIANRRRREVEPLIGMIINTLVMRVDASGDPSFAALLGRVRRVTADAYANQDLPLEKVVEATNPDRDASHNPYFQVMFSFHDAPLEAVELPGLDLGMTVALPNGSAKFDLNVTVILPREQRTGAGREAGEGEDDGAITFLWELDVDLFDETTIRRWIAAYRRLLRAVLEDPSTRLSELPMLDAAERHQVVAEWNDTARPENSQPPATLHELVLAQARRTPEAVAVSSGGRTLTYDELAAGALAVATRLQAAGIAREEPVAIGVERSLELAVGLLGILLAGGAYVPLDPDYPTERLALILEDTGARRLLVHGSTRERLLPLAGDAEVIDLDALPATDDGSRGAAAKTVDPASLAYIIHTSGSTGRPKGAMNSHRAIVNRLRWMQRAFGLTAGDRVLQKTPVSFDVSVWELFWPLLTGARLVMAAPGGHRDPGYLARTLESEGVTTLHFVPSMLRVFLEAEGVETATASVLRVMASGEALEADLVERFHQRFGAELHNLYGPTEAAVDVTHQPCPAGIGGRGVAIGRPVDETRILVLDRRGAPVPIGVAGELHIGGVQLARGYWRGPALTAERFVPDGVSGEAGARLYRTGDLARTRPGGEIDFLGRLDHQVKVRG
ncbi:MAG: amino acid adenylation domain-containing protein, partial [Acidobacteria bacterium]|nr:amino acid adenylation domain-containing protein [Acidobacteriota bacterium]